MSLAWSSSLALENAFASEGLVDLSGPVLRLQALTQEDFYVLLTKLRHVYASGDESAHLVPDEALLAFMRHCSEQVGDAYFRTPRTTIKAFCDLLAVLDQNPSADWRNLIGTVTLEPEHNPDLVPLEDEQAAGDEGSGTSQGDDDGFTTFRL